MWVGLGFRLLLGLCLWMHHSLRHQVNYLFLFGGSFSVRIFVQIPTGFKFRAYEVIIAWLEMFLGTQWFSGLRKRGITPSAD